MYTVQRNTLDFTNTQLANIEHTFRAAGWPYTLGIPAKKAKRMSDIMSIALVLSKPTRMEVFAYLREAAGCGEWLPDVVEMTCEMLPALGPIYSRVAAEVVHRMALNIPASVPGTADMLSICTLLKQKDYAFHYIAARHG